MQRAGVLSALSGWAAFGAAAITAFFIYGQLAQAHRQTTFIVGDEPPDVLIRRPTGLWEADVWVSNWNRRPIIIDGLSISSGNFAVRQAYYVDPKGDYHLRFGTQQAVKIPVDGYEDRSKPPPKGLIQLHITSDADDPVDLKSVSVRVRLRILGTRNTTKVIEAQGIDVLA